MPTLMDGLRGLRARGPRLAVFFTPRMVAGSGSFSPSAEKPAKVVEDWRRAVIPMELREPVPATRQQFALVHDAEYVEAVLSCTIPNGFGNRSREVAESLPWTVGAMVSAARYAVETKGVAVAPCSGFHHAGFERGGGYCTFNGLMVAAAVLRKAGLVGRVGILDCDMHEGDGTADIIGVIGARGWVRHFTAGAEFFEPSQSAVFFRRLEREVEAMADCDLVLYQAGADPHVHDPLGGFLGTDELRERDAIVFRRLKRLGVPVAWNLAGGYQKENDGSIPVVLEIHRNTANACLEASGKP
jgi:acetoin utilization deacetylase AcuC-like enzyme